MAFVSFPSQERRRPRRERLARRCFFQMRCDRPPSRLRQENAEEINTCSQPPLALGGMRDVNAEACLATITPSHW